jgi:hypothetical protein
MRRVSPSRSSIDRTFMSIFLRESPGKSGEIRGKRGNQGKKRKKGLELDF